MLKHILSFIRQLKTPEGKLNVIMPLAATIVLFYLLVNGNTGHELELKQRVRVLEIEKDSIRTVMQKQIDDCNAKILNDVKNHNAVLEKILNAQDSIKNSLKNHPHE